MDETSKALDGWLQAKTLSGRSEKTIDRYRNWLRGLVDAAPTPNLEDFRRWLADERRRLTHNGYASVVWCFRFWCKWMLQRTGNRDPWALILDDVETPRKKQVDLHIPSKEQAEAVIRWAMMGSEAWRDATVMCLLADLGLRIGEIAALTWEHVEFANGVLHVGEKHGQRRVLPINMTDRLHRVLLERRRAYNEQVTDRRKWGGGDEPPPHYVAASIFYRKPSADQLTARVIHKCCDGAGVSYFHAHLWRYYFLVQLLENEQFDLLDAQYCMGHESVQTTAEYYKRTGLQAKRMMRKMEATLPQPGELPWLHRGSSNGSSTDSG